jgi:hypothetical protein
MYQNLPSVLVTYHLLQETPPAPGLALKLQSVCEAPAAGPPPGGGDERRSMPREIFRIATAATERPATAHLLLFAAGPERDDEGGGLDVGAI